MHWNTTYLKGHTVSDKVNSPQSCILVASVERLEAVSQAFFCCQRRKSAGIVGSGTLETEPGLSLKDLWNSIQNRESQVELFIRESYKNNSYWKKKKKNGEAMECENDLQKS